MCYCSLLSSNAFPLSRFNPMSRGELTNLQVSVSILCHFEDGADWADWVVGTHGIRIEWFSERGNRKTATFLPEVPLAQGWDKTQTIDSLLRKGGFKGSVTPEVRRNIRLVRYQSEMVTVTYQDPGLPAALQDQVPGGTLTPASSPLSSPPLLPTDNRDQRNLSPLNMGLRDSSDVPADHLQSTHKSSMILRHPELLV